MTTAALLTVAEVAERLRVSHSTVKRLARELHLSGVRIGRQVRIVAESVDIYLASQTIRGKASTDPRRTEAWR